MGNKHSKEILENEKDIPLIETALYENIHEFRKAEFRKQLTN